VFDRLCGWAGVTQALTIAVDRPWRGYRLLLEQKLSSASDASVSRMVSLAQRGQGLLSASLCQQSGATARRVDLDLDASVADGQHGQRLVRTG
jgi:hypothetical protein